MKSKMLTLSLADRITSVISIIAIVISIFSLLQTNKEFEIMRKENEKALLEAQPFFSSKSKIGDKSIEIKEYPYIETTESDKVKVTVVNTGGFIRDVEITVYEYIAFIWFVDHHYDDNEDIYRVSYNNIFHETSLHVLEHYSNYIRETYNHLIFDYSEQSFEYEEPDDSYSILYLIKKIDEKIKENGFFDTISENYALPTPIKIYPVIAFNIKYKDLYGNIHEKLYSPYNGVLYQVDSFGFPIKMSFNLVSSTTLVEMRISNLDDYIDSIVNELVSVDAWVNETDFWRCIHLSDSYHVFPFVIDEYARYIISTPNEARSFQLPIGYDAEDVFYDLGLPPTTLLHQPRK